MIKAHRITSENVDKLSAIYERFSICAVSEYRWTFQPIAFEHLKTALRNAMLCGYWVEDTAVSEPVGLMLYRLEDHSAIEINLIYSELTDHKTILDRLIQLFIPDILELEGWDVVSYAMLGRQEAFIRTISWYGFKPVGQAILAFEFMDTLSVQIMRQQQLALPGPEYEITFWKPEYKQAVASCVFEAFSKATDALWDPRFRSLTGAQKAMAFILEGVSGQFSPSCTSIVLKDGHPVGFCFLVENNLTLANIPLIGVSPSEKGKGLGNHLLQSTLNRCIENMLAEKNSILKITTTMDTDNIPAIKMYRRMGFKEEYNYPHVYLTREKAQAFKPGKWC